MREGQPVGVKERAVQRAEHAVVGREMAADAAIDGVTDDRVADAVQVDADLVLTTGGDGDRRECQTPKTLGARHSCDGRPGATRAGGHLLAVHRVAAERGVDAATGVEQTPDQHHVLFLDLPVGELAGQLGVGGVVLGDDHHPRGAAVEAVDDAGALLAADAAEARDVVQQCVDQGAAGVAYGRVDDHAGRLVHHHQVGVVMNDRDRERLGNRGGGHRRRDLQVDDVARVHGVACPDQLLVQADVSVADQTLDL